MTASTQTPLAGDENSLDFLLSAAAVRQRASLIYQRALQGHTHFALHPEKLRPTAAFVRQVIEQNYPDKQVPYHSRWRHFEVGDRSQLQAFNRHCQPLTKRERARLGLELILPSVLVDAGAGAEWQYRSGGDHAGGNNAGGNNAAGNNVGMGRSEGLALASLDMFLAGGLSHRAEVATTAAGLQAMDVAHFEKYFQVRADNPLLGVAQRVTLLQQLGAVIASQPAIFPNQRLGDLLDYLLHQCGEQPSAAQLLTSVLNLFADIWPGRLNLLGRNLGDTWHYAPLGAGQQGYVPFHKLSQWLTYSIVETLEKSAFQVRDLNQLTGLAEYRNGGLMLDAGLISLRDPTLVTQRWPPASELIIEWRALTICLLDQLAECIRETLQVDAGEFPLAKVLEGGTWAAGRQLAQRRRGDLSPPLNIASDATVF